jgi:adenylate cyclase
VEVHAKGMKEPPRCRQLRGHEEHPELALAEETDCTPLAEPLLVQYVLLTGKHFDEQMEPATLVALSDRQAEPKARKPAPAYSDLLIRMTPMPGETEAPEFYAKVIRPVDEPGYRYLIHFTSIPPDLRARLFSLVIGSHV